MTSIAHLVPAGKIVVGVDTHKDVHVAVALDRLGAYLGEIRIATNAAGYADLRRWALSLGPVDAWGVEGTGSYGAGLAGTLLRAGERVIEVNRPDRTARRREGKSDALDAESAARAVLSGRMTGIPKSADGEVEAVRVIKVAKDGAVKSRTAAMNSLKNLLITAPAALRADLEPLSDHGLVSRCSGLRTGPVSEPLGATRHALRSLARRWQELDREIETHVALLGSLTRSAAPGLLASYGVGPDTAADLLIAAGDNPGRLHSEAAFAALCGASPIPASSGRTNRHRLNRGGDRAANAALYRIVVVRMGRHEPTIAYVARRTGEGRSKREIMRCLKRFLVRELYPLLRPAADQAQPAQLAS